MSDIRLYNYKKKKEYVRFKPHKEEIQRIIEENLFELLGLNFICNNVNLTNNNGEVVETLAYDEDMRLVVLEYHVGKFAPTISKGLEYLDYIRENVGKMKLFLTEKIHEKAKEIIYDPRLICIGEEYNSYDGKAIKYFPYDIDLIKFNLLDKEVIVLEKIYHNFIPRNIDFNEYNKLFLALDEIAISLGDEVSKTTTNYCVAYRRIKNFMYVFLEEGLNVVLKIKGNFKKYRINNLKDVDKISSLVEESYDAN